MDPSPRWGVDSEKVTVIQNGVAEELFAHFNEPKESSVPIFVTARRLVRKNGAMPAIDGGKIEISHEEPLKRELADFVAAVQDKRAPGVTGADGLRALQLAQKITDAMKKQEALGSGL